MQCQCAINAINDRGRFIWQMAIVQRRRPTEYGVNPPAPIRHLMGDTFEIERALTERVINKCQAFQEDLEGNVRFWAESGRSSQLG